jgi:predicted DNA binding CopG/RHH family protein
MPDKFTIPQFNSEAEEAQWWFNHRQELTQAFQDAADKGQLHSGSVARIARERAATGSIPTTTIRLDPDDISMARALAAKRGLRYQTYLKMLLHEALKSEQKKLVR